MKLPNAGRAVVDLRKLRDYCLNQVHPRGQHKARLFKGALGLTAQDVLELQQLLHSAARSEDAVALAADDYGQRYALDFLVKRSSGQATIRSLWIIRRGEDFPRLVTCYIL